MPRVPRSEQGFNLTADTGFDSNMATEVETTQALICGCGPTGAMLSGFLGRNNVSNVILEKENDITTDPRGIALDDDGIRLLQALGLYDAVFTDIGSCRSQKASQL